MELRRLVLKSFRNYEVLVFEPGPGINLLLGRNAQGKTNLLEAIYYLSTFSSPRAQGDSELVLWGHASFYLQGSFLKKGNPLLLEAGYDGAASRKEIRLDRQLVRQAAAVGQANAVLFTPEDLYLIKGYPQVRRQFLDREILQVNPLYGQHLSRYTRILRQRNRLLRDAGFSSRGRKMPPVDVWDQQLAEMAAFVLQKRREYVKKLALLARLQHRKLTDGGEDLKLHYASSLESTKGEGEFSREIIQEEFLLALKKSEEEERRRGVTLVGPHRDDLDFSINGRPARTYGSQGQQRTAALSLKLAQVELIKGERGNYPLLLLDDVFSELDRERQGGLLNLIRGRVQTFISGTGDVLTREKAFQEGSFYKIAEGRLSPWSV